MTSPDTTAIRAQMEALGGGTTDQQYVNEPKKMELVGRIHRVLNPENCSAAFVLAWNQPEAGEVDGTDEAIANARLIAAEQVREAYERHLLDPARVAEVKPRKGGRPLSGPHHAGIRRGRSEAARLIRALKSNDTNGGHQ